MINGTGSLSAVGDASTAAQDPTTSYAEWWAKMNRSLADATDNHANFHAYVMEGNGLCT